MSDKKNKNRLVPKLRFAEFRDEREWKETTLLIRVKPAVNDELITIEKKAAEAADKHNQFLKELGLPPISR
jgi:hypothetical protein